MSLAAGKTVHARLPQANEEEGAVNVCLLVAHVHGLGVKQRELAVGIRVGIAVVIDNLQ